ncbi:ABC transporter permease [Paenibacillus gorillae]|uniref:ABC transporter permease n=1 Tax=Paenibacillus gorillae TaxID=1243662 RepID=UPI0004B4AEC3|nr:ABC transporter permease [Paenibacillus gorillae]
MNLFKYEWMKIFSSRALLLLTAGLIVLNGVLIYLDEYNNRQAVPYTPAAYNQLYESYEGLPSKQIEAMLERAYAELLAIIDLESMLSNTAYTSESMIQGQLAERYPSIDIEALFSSYTSGSYLKYTNHSYEELLLTKEALEQSVNVNRYASFLQQKEEDAKILSSISIFAKEGSYSSKYVIKAANDYAGLSGVELSFERSKGVTMATQFLPTDLIAVFFILIAVVVMVTREKEQQLLNLVKTTYKGRAPLIVSKLFVLAAICVVIELLLYATNFAMAFQTYGFGELSRTIQSVQGFYESTWKISVGQYFLLFLLAKLFVYIVVAFVMMLIAVICQKSITVYMTIVAVFGLSTFFYYLVPPSSLMAFLKHINLVSFLNTYTLFSTYVNLNLLGQVINYRDGFPIAVIAASIALFSLTVRTFCRQKSHLSRSDWSVSLQEKWGRVFGHSAHVSLFRHEFYKIAIANKVLVIMVVFIGFQLYSYEPVVERIQSKDDLYYKQYMLKLEGELTPEKKAFLQEEQQKFDAAITELSHSSGEAGSTMNAMKMLDRKNAFDKVKAQADYLRDMEKQYGIKGWFLHDAGYLLLTDGTQRVVSEDLYLALLLVVVLIAAISPIFTYDLQTRMNRIVSLTPHGRGKLFYIKMTLALLIGAFVYAVIYGTRIVSVLGGYGSRAVQAPAFSMQHLSHVTLDMSILQYLMLIGVIRFAGVLMVIFMIGLISVQLKSLIAVMLASTGLLALPILLGIIGIRQFDYLLITPMLTGNVLFKSYSYVLLEEHRAIYLIALTAAVIIMAVILFRQIQKRA